MTTQLHIHASCLQLAILLQVVSISLFRFRLLAHKAFCTAMGRGLYLTQASKPWLKCLTNVLYLNHIWNVFLDTCWPNNGKLLKMLQIVGQLFPLPSAGGHKETTKVQLWIKYRGTIIHLKNHIWQVYSQWFVRTAKFGGQAVIAQTT